MSVKTARSARERRETQRGKRSELRKQNKAKAIKMVKSLMHSLVSKMEKCGFNKLTLSGYSGVCPATIGRIMKYRNLDTATFAAVVGMARAAGYKFEFVRLTPQEDEYFNERTVKLSEVEKLKTV